MAFPDLINFLGQHYYAIDGDAAIFMTTRFVGKQVLAYVDVTLHP